MKEDKPHPTGFITLEDQDFLKTIGITGLSPGLDFLLRQQKESREALVKIEARADGLTQLELNEATYKKLAKEQDRPIEDLRENFRLFRDITDLPDDEEEWP